MCILLISALFHLSWIRKCLAELDEAASRPNCKVSSLSPESSSSSIPSSPAESAPAENVSIQTAAAVTMEPSSSGIFNLIQNSINLSIIIPIIIPSYLLLLISFSTVQIIMFEFLITILAQFFWQASSTSNLASKVK